MRVRSNNFMVDGQDSNAAIITGQSQTIHNPDMVAEFRNQLAAWRADKPAPVTIAGMKEPDYTHISAAERAETIRNSPAGRE